jgi:hypothetical protein
MVPQDTVPVNPAESLLGLLRAFWNVMGSSESRQGILLCCSKTDRKAVCYHNLRI